MKSLFDLFDRIWFVRVLMLVLIVFVLSACTVAPAEGSSGGQVTEGMLYFIGIASSAIVYLVCVLAARFPQWKLTREMLTVLVYVFALGLAIWWAGFTIPEFPAFGDAPTFVAALIGFVTAFLTALGPTVAFALTIYNIILKRVLEGLAAKVGLGAQAGTASLSPGRK